MSLQALTFGEIRQLNSSSDDPRFKYMLRSELGRRVRQVVRTMLPSRIRSAVWMGILFADAKIIGESAAWACSSMREWRPRYLELLVPFNNFFNFTRNLARVAGNERYRFITPVSFPLAPVCVEITLTEAHKIRIYAAADDPDGMMQTLQSSPFSHYQSWVDLFEVFDTYPAFTRFQLGIADEDVPSDLLKKEKTFWRRNGWHIHVRGKARTERLVAMISDSSGWLQPNAFMPIVEDTDICDELF